ncbi:hypothetical protein O7634_05735 [Micromonospora sp. WMMD1120]|uniref:hypothetical protein n=1 Tax=Micromonospora sp. WMMD1120 TaxID=3016106 RepID=UPI00241638C6|nr:hypothetical protein [Micromonospora sp. WMMD1120]MDG4806256.1 hypothetical protein [Micromonospora sp. WMMD1120]
MAHWLVEIWVPYLSVVAIVVTIWAAASLFSRELLYLWPGWVAGPLGVVLLARTLAGLVGPGFPSLPKKNNPHAPPPGCAPA